MTDRRRPHDELIAAPATSLVARLRAGEITPHDCLDALERRIAAVDGRVNALPTLCFDRARRHADDLLKKPAAERGLLGGLPVAIKDLARVAGVRTTYGSPIHADLVPEVSDIPVEMIEREGGVVYAKSNTPEFGAGGNTFNPVFGATRNPWNLARSAAGSSGGAAAALASGTAWLAHGTDMGGSLRNPASFCGVVGMRPTPGRVATSNGYQIDQTLSVQGPMARNVEDLALFFDAMSGEHHGDLLSKPRPAQSFLSAATAGWKPKRVAYSRRSRDHARRSASRRSHARRGGADGEGRRDRRGGASGFFHRARMFPCAARAVLRDLARTIARETSRQLQAGSSLEHRGGADADAGTRDARAMATRRPYAQSRFLPRPFRPAADARDRDDRLSRGADTISPNATATNSRTTSCGSSIAYAITLCGAPAISIPCGFTDENLPVGLQIVAPTNCDARAIAGAAYVERLLGTDTAPIDPRG